MPAIDRTYMEKSGIGTRPFCDLSIYQRSDTPDGFALEEVSGFIDRHGNRIGKIASRASGLSEVDIRARYDLEVSLRGQAGFRARSRAQMMSPRAEPAFYRHPERESLISSGVAALMFETCIARATQDKSDFYCVLADCDCWVEARPSPWQPGVFGAVAVIKEDLCPPRYFLAEAGQKFGTSGPLSETQFALVRGIAGAGLARPAGGRRLVWRERLARFTARLRAALGSLRRLGLAA